MAFLSPCAPRIPSAYSHLVRISVDSDRRWRRVLAPLRRCFADDGRRTRLRALYEDAALARGKRRGGHRETDPTSLPTARSPTRRGAAFSTSSTGRARPSKLKRRALGGAGPAQRAGAEMAGVWPPKASRRPRSTASARRRGPCRAAGAHRAGAPRSELEADAAEAEQLDGGGGVGDAEAFGTRAPWSARASTSRRSWSPPGARGVAGRV